MQLNRIEPWAFLNLMNRDLERMLGRNYADEDSAIIADWVPAADVLEFDDRFVLRADLPGVDPRAIDVNMEKGVLSVSGERLAATDEETASSRHAERGRGRFHRRFSLPDSADADSITARSANGVLEITIPKLARVQARRITVSAAD